jgi:hypothetical protein
VGKLAEPSMRLSQYLVSIMAPDSYNSKRLRSTLRRR